MQQSASVEAAQVGRAVAGASGSEPARTRSFPASFAVIGAAAVLAFAFEKLRPGSFLALIPVLAAGALAVRFRRELRSILTSVPFAVALVCVLIAATALGTLILQNGAPAEYLKHHGKAAAAVLRWLGLDDVFHSLWFGSLMALLAVSLVLVVLKRGPLRASRLGFVLSHLGIVAILTGALVGRAFGQRGTVRLDEGQSGGVLQVGNDRQADLGFDVRLDRFDVERYPGEYRICAYREGKLIASFGTSDAGRHAIPGTDVGFRVRPGGPGAPVTLDLRQGEGTATVRIEDAPGGSALLEDGTVLALEKRRNEVRSYRSAVSIWRDGRRLGTGTVAVNSPLDWGGYTIYQYDADPARPTYSVLLLVKDRGLPLVYAGFAMLALGVLWIFYIWPRIAAREVAA